MSDARDELERLQVAVKALEAREVPDAQLEALAEALEREAAAYEQMLEKNERRAEASERGGLSGRVMAFGFSLLFVTPIVAIIGVSLAKLLRHETELAVAVLAFGVVLIVGTSFSPLRHLVAHRASGEWKRARDAVKQAEALRALIND